MKYLLINLLYHLENIIGFNMKYIYFEIRKISDIDNPLNKKEEIQNANILLIKPKTNGSGVWGHRYMTDMYNSHRSGLGAFADSSQGSLKIKSIIVTDQYWIDIDKYKNYRKDSKYSITYDINNIIDNVIKILHRDIHINNIIEENNE